MILLLGGTHESRDIATCLLRRGDAFVMSVATALGLQVYGEAGIPCIHVQFTEETLYAWLVAHEALCVIDATHPHAREITQTAQRASARAGIPYLRYARDAVDVSALCEEVSEGDIASFPDMAAALGALAREAEQYGEAFRCLITGVKHIGEAYAHLPKAHCYFRIMPSRYSIEQCERWGVPLERIIGIKTPCPPSLTAALFKAYDITHFVFKNSGAGSAVESNVEALCAYNRELASNNGGSVKGYVVSRSEDTEIHAGLEALHTIEQLCSELDRLMHLRTC